MSGWSILLLYVRLYIHTISRTALDLDVELIAEDETCPEINNKQ